MRLDPPSAVGFVGLGHMGLPMAARLVDAGYAVRGYDVDASARAAYAEATGSEPAASVADAARAPVVALSLPNSAAVRQVLLDDGLLDAMEDGALLVDMGSSDPTQTRELADVAARRGVQLVDAPVSGGVRGARAGTLAVMVGGPEDRVAECRPLLDVIGGTVRHVGTVGAGHALKALNNLLSATSLLISSEALEAGRRFGLDPEVMIEVINGSSGRSYSTEHKLPDFVLPETYSAGFALYLLVKDIRTALAVAHAAGTPIELGEAVVALWERAAAELPEDADHTEIARWVADRRRS